MLIVLTGKTASGKDTVKNRLLLKFPNLKRVITTTSRSQRSGEQDGIDYHFLSREEFEKKVEDGEFAEFVEYGGNLYGTYKSELENGIRQDALWKIDPSRAGEVRDFISRTFPIETAQNLVRGLKVIYVTVSDDVILERLKKRGLSEEEIQKRMEDDGLIWSKFKDKYDFVLENVPGKLEETVDKIIRVIG